MCFFGKKRACVVEQKKNNGLNFPGNFSSKPVRLLNTTIQMNGATLARHIPRHIKAKFFQKPNVKRQTSKNWRAEATTKATVMTLENRLRNSGRVASRTDDALSSSNPRVRRSPSQHIDVVGIKRLQKSLTLSNHDTHRTGADEVLGRRR